MFNILLDRDGTLIEEKSYLSRPDGVKLLPGAGQALKTLQDAGCNLYLVTNQSGIGRGLFSLEHYQRVQARLKLLLAAHGVFFQDHLFCPHAPWDRCSCRKPRIGMWRELVRKHGLLPRESVMIGDKPADLEFGARAGLRCRVLVLTGYGRRTAQRLGCPDVPDDTRFFELDKKDEGPDLLARDLPAAAAWIRSSLGSEMTDPSELRI